LQGSQRVLGELVGVRLEFPDGHRIKKYQVEGKERVPALGINNITRRLDNSTTAKQDPPEKSLSLFCSFQKGSSGTESSDPGRKSV
jgi:hypothetical protein